MATFYVATTGNDSNPGSIGSPFLTIGHGVSVLASGDTLIVRAGTYAESLINTPIVSGTFGAQTLIQAFAGETVWLKPPNPGNQLWTAIYLANHHYITFDGIGIDTSNATQQPMTGLKTSSGGGDNADHITYKNAEIIGNRIVGASIQGDGFGIAGLSNSSTSVGNNSYINVKIHGFQGTAANPTRNYGFYVSPPNNLFDGLEIYDCGAQCGQIHDENFGVSNNNIIRNCKFHDINTSGLIGNTVYGLTIDGTNNLVENCLFYNLNNGNPSDNSHGVFSIAGSISGKFYNNTIFNNNLAAFVGGTGTSSNEIINNIAWSNTLNGYVGNTTGLVIHHNLFGIDPKFTDSLNNNFHLQSISPAINQGATLALVPKDFDGLTRPQGSAYCIGAFEFPVGSGPINIDAAHAVEIGPLPNTILQNVNFGGVTNTVWYKYTARAGDTVIGFFAFGDLVAYFPITDTFSPDGVTPYLVAAAVNVPIQIPVVPGVVYYFRLTSQGGNVATANLTVNGQQAPNTNFPIGSILVNDATVNFPLAIINSTTGAVLKFVTPFPSGEGGSILNSGVTIWEDISVTGQVKIFNPNLSLVGTFNIGFGSGLGGLKCSSDKTTQFYVGDPGGGLTHAKVIKVSPAGVLGGTTYDLGGAGLVAISPSNDNTILYYSGTGSSLNAAIKRWDLVNNVALTDLVVGIANYITLADIIVLTDGTLLVAYFRSAPNDTLVKHYSAAGATLNTYDFLGVNTGSAARIAQALNDPSSFWIFLHLTNGDNRFTNVRISDGSTIATFDAPAYEVGIFQEAQTATPSKRFGASGSCPILITRVFAPPTFGTLIVNKVVNPSTDTTVFNFTAGGGLSPAMFSLLGGGSQVYNNVNPGNYSISEGTAPGFLTVISVSNGSPPSNIAVHAGETVTVTVTNSKLPGGMYFINIGKVNDTIFTTPGSTIKVQIP